MAAPVIVFDVNETLSDLGPVAEAFTVAGAPVHLAELWFAVVLRDGFAAAVSGDLVRFADLGRNAARALLAEPVRRSGVDLEVAVDQVLRAFTSLDLHPDVAPGIRALAGSGARMVTLSNGSASVAEGLLTRAGLRDLVEHVLSVEDAGIWKPAARAYCYAAETCAVEPADLLMVAVHPWDLHGAHAAGLRTCWVNRPGSDRPLQYPAHFSAPDHVVSGVGDLVGVHLGG